jgi:hypothetical protein
LFGPTETWFAGKWNEVTRDAIGDISGTITSTGIPGKIDGIGFTADLAISTQANGQSVTIDPARQPTFRRSRSR